MGYKLNNGVVNPRVAGALAVLALLEETLPAPKSSETYDVLSGTWVGRAKVRRWGRNDYEAFRNRAHKRFLRKKAAKQMRKRQRKLAK